MDPNNRDIKNINQINLNKSEKFPDAVSKSMDIKILEYIFGCNFLSD